MSATTRLFVFDAVKTVVAPVMTPNGSFVPEPTANFDASSTSFESAIIADISEENEFQSCPISIENGTNARAISVDTVGCASVGAASVTAAASAWNVAVIPADVTPRHSSTV